MISLVRGEPMDEESDISICEKIIGGSPDKKEKKKKIIFDFNVEESNSESSSAEENLINKYKKNEKNFETMNTKFAIRGAGSPINQMESQSERKENSFLDDSINEA